MEFLSLSRSLLAKRPQQRGETDVFAGYQLDKLSLTDKFTKQESFKKGLLRGAPNSCSTVNETKSSWSQLKVNLNLDFLYVYGRGAVFGDTYE